MVRSQQERTTEEVHLKFLECFHHGQQLFAGGAILSFISRVFLTEVRYHTLLATLLLEQYSAQG